ncbi:hypothetical protein [Halostagnicola sp. A56]|uniref:hypothetical protein n=1 Tax=Halostagnicola sp. A56 TaxID=1495067 RepID=UPI0012E0FF7C|nr:hypothetical protein [Halostagnicola sp. A56]
MHRYWDTLTRTVTVSKRRPSLERCLPLECAVRPMLENFVQRFSSHDTCEAVTPQ